MATGHAGFFPYDSRRFFGNRLAEKWSFDESYLRFRGKLYLGRGHSSVNDNDNNNNNNNNNNNDNDNNNSN